MEEPTEKRLPDEVVRYLVRCRKAAKLTQSNVAELMSVDLRTVQYWEGQESAPSLKNFMRLCDVVGADIREVQRRFLGREPAIVNPVKELEDRMDTVLEEGDRAVFNGLVQSLRGLWEKRRLQ